MNVRNCYNIKLRNNSHLMHFFKATSRSSSTSKKQQAIKTIEEIFIRMKEKERNMYTNWNVKRGQTHFFWKKIKLFDVFAHSLTENIFFSSLIFSLDVDGGGEKLVFDFMFMFIYIYSYEYNTWKKDTTKTWWDYEVCVVVAKTPSRLWSQLLK